MNAPWAVPVCVAQGLKAGQSLNLARLMTVVRARRGATPAEAVLPSELRAIADEMLEAKGAPPRLSYQSASCSALFG